MEWISIKEACRITDRSDTTIRRLVKTGYTDKSLGIRVEKQGRFWKIDKSSLLSYYQSFNGIDTSDEDKAVDSSDRLIDSLEDRVQAMQEQLENKDTQIQALNVHLMQANERVKMLEDRISEMETEGNERKGRGLLGRIIKMLPV